MIDFDIITEFVQGLIDKYPFLQPYLSNLKFRIAFLLILISFSGYIFSWIKTLYKKWLSNKYQKDLHPYFTVKQVFDATKYYIPTNFQNVSPSEDEEPSSKFIASAKNKLMPLFINKLFKFNGDEGKYYLILADSGMGKTTFLINLFLTYRKKRVLFGKKFDILLLPLGSPNIWSDIDSISDEKKANTILLLDAFDEDNEAILDYKKRMQFVLSKVWRFREVVITCRTQFFPREIDETAGYTLFPDGSGQVFKFQKVYLSVFSRKDIFHYLLKKFNVFNPLNWVKLLKANLIVIKSPSLMVRPMLLSYVDDFLDTKKPFESIIEIYDVLIEKWIDREAHKSGIIEKYRTPQVYKEKLYNFSMAFALDLYKNRSERGGFFMPYSEEFIAKDGLTIEEFGREFIDFPDQKSRSLLNRNAQGDFKFSHKSIFEFFLFKNALNNDNFLHKVDFDGLNMLRVFLINHLYYSGPFSNVYFSTNLSLPFIMTYPQRIDKSSDEPLLQQLPRFFNTFLFKYIYDNQVFKINAYNNFEVLLVDFGKMKPVYFKLEALYLKWVENMASDSSDDKDFYFVVYLLERIDSRYSSLLLSTKFFKVFQKLDKIVISRNRKSTRWLYSSEEKLSLVERKIKRLILREYKKMLSHYSNYYSVVFRHYDIE